MKPEGPSPPPSPTVNRRARSAFRVPILAVVLAVGACAMAFAALRIASEPWYMATYTYIVFVLLTSVLAARFARGAGRAFWFGFAVFGWGFFYLAYQPWISPFWRQGYPNMRPNNPNLLSSWIIVYLTPILRKPTNNLNQIDPITWNTMGIAHMLLTLIVGSIGGLLACLFRRRSRGRIPPHMIAILSALVIVGAVAIASDRDRPTARYFPPDLFAKEPETERWYSRQLAAMGEPSMASLAEHDPRAIAYRFLWLPAFTHPLCVRIERDGDGARLRAVVLDGQGGYDPGHIAIDRTLRWTGEQWNQLERLVEDCGPWEPIPDSDMLDGTTLIVEGVKEGNYQMVERSEPGPQFRAVGRYVLAGTEIDMSGKLGEYFAEPSGFEGAE